MSARAAGKALTILLLAVLAGSTLAQLPNPDTRLPVPKGQPQGQGLGIIEGDSPGGPTLGDDRDMIDASQKWLKLLDDGHVGPAWDIAAPSLKASVTRKDWIKGISTARKPFGKVASRKAEKFARSHELPGLPEGDYALLLFDTRFANGKQAQEHITWSLGKGDVWRVTGYFIK